MIFHVKPLKLMAISLYSLSYFVNRKLVLWYPAGRRLTYDKTDESYNMSPAVWSQAIAETGHLKVEVYTRGQHDAKRCQVEVMEEGSYGHTQSLQERNAWE